MNDAGVCECDPAAYERGDPFCGFCGRRIGSPWLHDLAGELPLNLPHAVPAKPPAGQPFLTLHLIAHEAAPGIVESARFVDNNGRLLLSRLELFCLGRKYELAPVIDGGSFSFSLPRELDGGGLPSLAALRCTFDLRFPALNKPLVFTLPLQPEGVFALSSDDSRFEDVSQAVAITDPYTVWLFEDNDAPVTLLLSAEFRAGVQTFPDFTTARISRRGSARSVDAGGVFNAAVQAALIELQPAALRELLAGTDEGRVHLRLDTLNNDESAVFDIHVLARRAPKLYLEPPVLFQINFKAHKKGWLTTGSEDLKSILNYEDDVRLWSPQFELGIAPSVELDEAAHFSAKIDVGYLTITAAFKPEWLNTARVAPLAGSAKLLLRNANNSRQHLKIAPPDTVEPMAVVKIVIDWDKRGSVPVLAIDFGTTNTCAAVIPSYNDVTSREIEINGESDCNVPTLLFYNLAKNESGNECVASVVFGKQALSEGRRVISSTCFKRGIKTDLLNPKQRAIPVGENLSLSARELTTDYLTQFLKAAMLSPDIDGRPIERLVYTFPVAASPLYSEMLGGAFADAVENLRLPIRKENIVKSCDEASAGGIWWFCKKKSEILLPDKVSLLVFDYGGGTTDLSVLEFNKVGETWQVTIKGISGISPAGGEDLTWRMGREFIACVMNENRRQEPLNPVAERQPLRAIRPDSVLGKNLTPTSELQGREEWQRKPYTRYLLEVIEERKIAAVGGEQINTLPAPVFLDLLEGAESAFVPSAIDFRTDAVALADSCAQGGSVAMCKFSEYKQEQTEFVAAMSPEEGMLPGHVWLFKVQARLLEEPIRAVEVASNLIKHLYGSGKVDYLLLIGQASKTRAVQSLIRSKLGAQFGEIAAEGMQKPKSCVALGACDFHLQRDDWDFRPTLLHRIIYLDGIAFKQVLRSDAERNSVVTLSDPDVLRRPGTKLAVLVDCSYANRGEDGLRQEMEQLGPNGFERAEPGKNVSIVVAAPSDAATFAKLDPRIQAIAAEWDRSAGGAHYWYFLAWVEDDLKRAWIFRYTL